MAEQHRATAEQWALIERMRHHTEFSTILELLHRIEALEARDEGDKIDWTKMRRPGRSQGERIASLVKRIEALEAAQQAKPNHPAKPDSSLERRVSEHIKAQSVLTAALIKRLEALEGVPLDGAVPAKVPGGLPALAEKVKALEDTAKPNHPKKPDSSLVERVACAIYPDGSGDGFREEARAAIREVAAWLREHFPHGAGGWAMRLEREAER